MRDELCALAPLLDITLPLDAGLDDTGSSEFPALKTIHSQVSQAEAQLAEMRSELAATRGTIVRQVKLSSDELAIKLRTQFSTSFLGRLIANQEAEIEK
ncbi:unnamed protein product, partial [Dibothriocephalus latus]